MEKIIANHCLHTRKSIIKSIVIKGNNVLYYSINKKIVGNKWDYIVVDNLIGEIEDVQTFFESVRNKVTPKTRIVITYHSRLWEPFLRLATILGFRKAKHEQNWLDEADIVGILSLAGFENIKTIRRILCPLPIPILSSFINNYVALLPVINNLCLVVALIARPKGILQTDKSVSIVVPARNEAGNIGKIISTLPKFGKYQEIIFVEGHSTDNTWEEIQKILIKRTKKISSKLTINAYKQIGIGKADAVRLGFSKARGDILMILDSDLTVQPQELKKFYQAYINGHGEFINGSRLVYPMEKEAMRTLNEFGNRFFSMIFTWILGQRFKDTLCGTKVISRHDYLRIQKLKSSWNSFDPFGDFELIFGAVKLNLKVVEIPVRYRERTYGRTNISRFKHGLQLLQMTWLAFKQFSR